MESSPASERGSLEIRRFALQGLEVEVCCDGADLSAAVGFVLVYFGLTPVSISDAKEQGGRRLAADLRLAFHAQGPPVPLPKRAEHPLVHNGVELWRSGPDLHLREGSSAVEISSDQGSALGVISLSPWRTRPDEASVDAPGLLRLGFVNLVLHTLLVLLTRRGYFPLHAAALARAVDGAESEPPAGVLMAAPSDSGKSTLAMGLVRAGWGFLSDDSILLRAAAAGGEAVVEALPLRREFGLDEEAVCDFPEIVGHRQPFLTAERKQRVDMRALYPGRVLTRCAPRLLLFPEITASHQSRFEPMGGAETLLALISQSPLLGACREDAPAHLDVLRRAMLQAPAFRLRAGRDLRAAPERLSKMVSALLSQCSTRST